MTLKGLRDLLRAQRLDDVAAPQLWTDIELNYYLNEAEKEAAIRTRCLIDSEFLSFTGTDQYYDVDPLVIEIIRAHRSGDERPLAKTTLRELDSNVWNWKTHTGRVTHWFMDGWNRFGLYRAPVESTTVSLTVIRRPLSDMESDDDEPEIPEHFHDYLLDWAESLARRKSDSDTFRPDQAAVAEARFERTFGPRPTANVLTQRAVRNTRRVRGLYI